MLSAAMSAQAAFRFFPAVPPLSAFVDHFYFSQVPQAFVSQVDAMRLPEVEAQLVFAIEDGKLFPGGQHLGGGQRACLFLQPAHLQMIPIPRSIRGAVGASLRPAGLRLLLPKGAGSLIDSPLIALEDILGAPARALLERMAMAGAPCARLQVLRQFLSERVALATRPSGAMARAVELIRSAHGEISTEQLAEACGCTSRTLRSLAVAETGLAPKHLARVARIRRALELLSAADVKLSDAALASAFSDQAHMSREFRELIGAPPASLSERMRSGAVPSFNAERNLMSTGLLVMPRFTL
jgi:methylphosphotriester-DNA--protein-cysteine methyltransferase